MWVSKILKFQQHELFTQEAFHEYNRRMTEYQPHVVNTDMPQNIWNHSQLAIEAIYRRRDKNCYSHLHKQLNFVNKHGTIL